MKQKISRHPPKVSGKPETKGFGAVKNQRFLTKGQSLSLNTIIIAILVLIVLVVLVVIFTGRLGMWNKAVDQCASSVCVDSPADCTDGAIPTPANCNPDDTIDYCCEKPGST